jgi:uncharacterized lipoprotein YddW (UPF0748 family)
MISLLFSLTVCACLSVCIQATSFLQATWLPVSYHTATADDVQSTLQNLSSHGVQRVYVDVWNQGVVYFQSPTMQSLMGTNSNSQGRDILLWTLQAAKPFSIEVVAWLEYGFMCSYQTLENPFAAEANRRGWVAGLYSSFYWMNPSLKEVQDFLNGIISDALTNYASMGLLGVQLDDHFAFPVALGGSKEVMDSMMKSIFQTVQTIRTTDFPQTEIILSLAPSTLSLSLDTYSVDWNLWGDQGLYDEVIPQLYRSDYSSFVSIFNETVQGVTENTRELLIASGIRVDGSGSSTPAKDVQLMMDYSNSFSVGNSVWYARGILETYPEIFLEEW